MQFSAAPVIDVHVHLTPPTISQDRTRFIKGEGAWAKIYENPKAPMASTDELIATMDAQKVDAALVMGFPWSNEETAKLHNEWLLEEAVRHPGRLIPLAAFDLLAPWAVAHAEEMLTAGMSGLGELALYDRGFGPLELELLGLLGDICRQKNKLFLVHVNEPIGHQYPGKAPLEISQIYELVRACQGVKLILAHFGGGLPLFAALKKEVGELLSGVYFDTAAMPFLFKPQVFTMALEVLGLEHFLFGSDFPLLPPDRYRRYLAETGLAPEQVSSIMGASAATLLKDVD